MKPPAVIVIGEVVNLYDPDNPDLIPFEETAMIEIVNKFEKLIYALLMIMLMAVLIAAVVDLGWTPDHITDPTSPRGCWKPMR